MRFILLLFFFSGRLFAQTENQILDPDICTVQLNLAGSPLSLPIVNLQTSANVLVLEFFAARLSDRFPTLVRYLLASLSQVLQTHNTILDRAAPPLPLDAAIMPEPRAIILIGVIFIILCTASFAIFSHQDLGG